MSASATPRGSPSQQAATLQNPGRSVAVWTAAGHRCCSWQRGNLETRLHAPSALHTFIPAAGARCTAHISRRSCSCQLAAVRAPHLCMQGQVQVVREEQVARGACGVERVRKVCQQPASRGSGRAMADTLLLTCRVIALSTAQHVHGWKRVRCVLLQRRRHCSGLALQLLLLLPWPRVHC